MDELKKRTWAQISLENIKHNYEMIRKALPQGTKFLGVVKADAYGHGAVEVAGMLEANKADYLAVSCLDEAMELRNAGIRMPILILGHTPYQFTYELIENHITQTVTCLAKAWEYSRETERLRTEKKLSTEDGYLLKVHIAVDTGMSRLGFLCDGSLSEDGVDNIATACRLPGLETEGIFTHFAVSDEDGDENEAYTRKQFKLFKHVISELEDKHGIGFAIKHCANTGAVLNYPEMALDMVRPGLLLYGYGDMAKKLNLKPGMNLITTIGTIKYFEAGTSISYGRRFVTGRRTRIGVLGIGYADGLLRSMSNKANFYVCGRKAPQLGTICMDMCMIDLTDVPEAKVGTEVEIFGEHRDINKLAEISGTIPYELLCSVSKRVPRVYI